MKVVVDSARCEGHARCWQICPEVFSLDDNGHSVVYVDVVPAELEARVQEALENCPERAISLR
jgi:ferredoxin